MQYVRVEVAEGRAYTYTWDDRAAPPLQAGERVLLPANMVQDKTFEGRVLRLLDGPDPHWDGEYKSVVSRVGPPPAPKGPDPWAADEDLL